MSQSANEKVEFRPPKILFAYFVLIAAWAANALLFFATTDTDLIIPGHGTVRVADFFGYYQAAKLGATSTHIYDFSTQLAQMNQIIAPNHTDLAWAVPYPPTFYFMAAPLSYLSLQTAYDLWKFVTVPLGLLAAAVLVFSQKRFSKIDCWAILVALVANTPALIAIRSGQFSFPQLAIISMFCWAFIARRDIVCGLMLGLLALIKPHYAIFLALPTMTMRRWKVLIGAVPVATLIALATGMHFGWHVFIDYVHYLSDVYTSANYAGISASEQVNLRALIMYDLLHISNTKLIMTFGTISLLSGLAFSLWMWVKAARRAELFNWVMAVTLVISIFLGPHVHIHDCLTLGVAAILTIPSVSPKQIFLRHDRAYQWWCLTMFSYPLVSFISFNLSIIDASIRLIPVLAQNLILTISGTVYVVHLLKRPPEETASVQP